MSCAAAWQDSGLNFTTQTRRPIEPRHLARSFRRICDTHGLRVISVYHVRRTKPCGALWVLGDANMSERPCGRRATLNPIA
jgi:hypothetical protein